MGSWRIRKTLVGRYMTLAQAMTFLVDLGAWDGYPETGILTRFVVNAYSFFAARPIESATSLYF